MHKEYTKRAVIVEFNNYHGEVLPSLAYLLNQLGYWVNIYTTKSLIKLNPFVMAKTLDCSMDILPESFSIEDWQKKVGRYDLLVWNSIEPERHLPIVTELNTATLAIVHNAHRICGGEYADYFSSPYRQAIVLSPHLQTYFANNGLDAEWIFPSYYSSNPMESTINSGPVSYCVQGKVEFKRRNYLSMLRASKKMAQSTSAKPFMVRYLGKSNSFEGFALRALVLLYGLRKFSKFSSQVSLYQEYFSELAQSDFLCPLIDTDKEIYQSYYEGKASSSIPIALGNNLIPIVQREFAELYDIQDISVCYEDGGLYEALCEAMNMQDDELLEKKNRISEENKRLLTLSKKNLASAISRLSS